MDIDRLPADLRLFDFALNPYSFGYPHALNTFQERPKDEQLASIPLKSGAELYSNAPKSSVTALVCSELRDSFGPPFRETLLCWRYMLFRSHTESFLPLELINYVGVLLSWLLSGTLDLVRLSSLIDSHEMYQYYDTYYSTAELALVPDHARKFDGHLSKMQSEFAILMEGSSIEAFRLE